MRQHIVVEYVKGERTGLVRWYPNRQAAVRAAADLNSAAVKHAPDCVFRVYEVREVTE